MQIHGKQPGRVGAYGEEGGKAQVEHAAEADDEVQPQRQTHEDLHLHGNADDVGILDQRWQERGHAERHQRYWEARVHLGQPRMETAGRRLF